MKCPYCGNNMVKVSTNHFFCEGDNISLIKRWVLVFDYERSNRETAAIIESCGVHALEHKPIWEAPE